MLIKGIIDCDLVNYKEPCLTIETPKCNFKCDKECGERVCQNSELAKAPTIEINDDEIIQRYLNNPITEAITIGGLEPFDTFEEPEDSKNQEEENNTQEKEKIQDENAIG